jgi:lipopolysaccharide export system protein LptC
MSVEPPIRAAAILGAERKPVVRDWSARPRESTVDAASYSRFVMLMKRALPIGASFIFAAVLIFAFLPRQTDKVQMFYRSLGRIDNDLTMTAPRLTGTDEKGHPFVVTADHAVQDVRDPHRARLFGVESDVTMDNDRWLNATAARGTFDMDKSSLNLSGGISTFSDTGYELHTSYGHVDLKRGQFEGPATVTGQGPLGTFRADRFRIDHVTQMIYLNGNVHMTLYLKNASAGKAK